MIKELNFSITSALFNSIAIIINEGNLEKLYLISKISSKRHDV